MDCLLLSFLHICKDTPIASKDVPHPAIALGTSLTFSNDTHHHLHSSLGGILCPEGNKIGKSEGTDVCNDQFMLLCAMCCPVTGPTTVYTMLTSFLVAGVAPLPAPDHGLAAPAAKEAACSVFVPCV